MNPIGVAHATGLAVLHAQAFPPEERWDEAAFAGLLSLPGVFGWIAGEMGFVLARVAADEAEILTLAIRPEARRQGIGRGLMQAAMVRAGQLGATVLYLEVARSNAAACALYHALGFAQAGHRRRYYPDGGDALVLRRDLSPDAARAP